jgi:outer membrane protein OmpA-like peptidoglycan-associated protein
MKMMKRRLTTAALFAVTALLFAGCATFEGSIPVESDFAPLTISPKNQDGIQDELRLTVSIPEMKGLKVKEYLVEIRSSTGELVFQEGKAETEGGLFRRKRSVDIPKELVWDGRTVTGKWAADGPYSLQIQAADYQGNSGSYGPVDFRVDNTPPRAEVILPYAVFSPNGDGSQDMLDVYQFDSSSENLWEGVFTNESGKVTRSFQWNGPAPRFSWDGKDASGQAVSEGVYNYTLSSTDEGGNRFTLTLGDIRIDNSRFPVTLTLLTPPAFSPNGDGFKDTVRFGVTAAEPERILSLSLAMMNEEGKNMQDLYEESPGEFVFRGIKEGRTLPEGFYYGTLKVKYVNGDTQQLVSERISLDLTPPQAVLRIPSYLFSPDGDSRKDELVIYQTTSPEMSWKGTVLAGERAIRTWTWTERALTATWDGREDSGQVAADGPYRYRLEGEDLAGNRKTFLTEAFTLDTTPTPVRLNPAKLVFSPNGDGDDDSLTFNMAPAITTGIEGWRFSVRNEEEKTVFTLTEPSDVVPPALAWDGRNSEGMVQEGRYQAVLEVLYLKGNLGQAVTEMPFTIDVSPPQITLKASPLPFSPDGDGVDDALTITVGREDPSGIRRWSARILDPTGVVFHTFDTAASRNGVLNWNGKDRRGELVQSASDYTLEVTAEDNVGNRAVASTVIPIDILVLKDGDRLKISISSIYFKPNTADYLDVDPELRQKNLETLDRLAVILARYGQYKIQLEGHAVRVYWNDPARWQNEERETLMPLSQERAERIQAALTQRGIAGTRMTSTGAGGYRPVVPHGDLVNRWKNRRVEFILVK